MRIFFETKEPEVALKDIEQAIQGRKLGEMVTFSLENKNLMVTIQKLGKSELEFSFQKPAKGKTEWALTREKIALSHRAFKSEVMGKITKIVTSVGGEVLN